MLDHITDADALFRWALDALPRRNRMSDEERARVDEAFLARAEALGAKPDLLRMAEPELTRPESATPAPSPSSP